MLFRMPLMPFPMPPLFITAVKDICTINTFEELLNILFSEVYCLHFSFPRLLFSAVTTDIFLYEVLKLFPCWPLIFWSFLLSPLIACDVVTPACVTCSMSIRFCNYLLHIHLFLHPTQQTLRFYHNPFRIQFSSENPPTQFFYDSEDLIKS